MEDLADSAKEYLRRQFEEPYMEYFNRDDSYSVSEYLNHVTDVAWDVVKKLYLDEGDDSTEESEENTSTTEKIEKEK